MEVKIDFDSEFENIEDFINSIPYNMFEMMYHDGYKSYDYDFLNDDIFTIKSKKLRIKIVEEEIRNILKFIRREPAIVKDKYLIDIKDSSLYDVGNHQSIKDIHKELLNKLKIEDITKYYFFGILLDELNFDVCNTKSTFFQYNLPYYHSISSYPWVLRYYVTLQDRLEILTKGGYEKLYGLEGLTESQARILYEELYMKNYITGSIDAESFILIFTGQEIPLNFKSRQIEWSPSKNKNLLAYLMDVLFPKKERNFWKRVACFFEGFNNRTFTVAINNYQINDEDKPKGYEEIDLIISKVRNAG